jgi:hypothetical protein
VLGFKPCFKKVPMVPKHYRTRLQSNVPKHSKIKVATHPKQQIKNTPKNGYENKQKWTNFRFERGDEVVHKFDLWIISPCAIISHSYHILQILDGKSSIKEPLVSLPLSRPMQNSQHHS